MFDIVGKVDAGEAHRAYRVTEKCRLKGNSWVILYNFLLKAEPGSIVSQGPSYSGPFSVKFWDCLKMEIMQPAWGTRFSV